MACFRNQGSGRKEPKPEPKANGGALALASIYAGFPRRASFRNSTRLALEPTPANQSLSTPLACNTKITRHENRAHTHLVSRSSF